MATARTRPLAATVLSAWFASWLGACAPVLDMVDAPAPAASASVAAYTVGADREMRWDGGYGSPSVRGASAGLALRLRPRGARTWTGELMWRVRPLADPAGLEPVGAPAFVQVSVTLADVAFAPDHVVLGTVAYADPACGCTVASTFTGAMRGDTLAGRFVTRGAATTADRRGRWWLVQRHAAGDPIAPAR